ncbi:MAG: cellulose biosynthesis protein BcsS [Pseudomonadota bacterium]
MPRREVFGGVETASNYATVYAGGGYAFGGGFYEPGWRIRAVGAWGAYDYNRMLFDGSAYSDTTFNGQVAFLSAQVGYQFHQGRTIVAGFIGMEAVDQAVSPFDPGNAIQGTELGLRLTLETWTDISDLWFLSADGGYGTAFQEYWQLSRIGYRLGSVFAVGAEGGILGNQEYDAGRVGGFIRGTFNAVEATVSAGFSGEYLLGDPGGYASVNLYRKF